MSLEISELENMDRHTTLDGAWKEVRVFSIRWLYVQQSLGK